MDHGIFMHRCFQLASLGIGNVAPNPLVGAVLVYNQRVIAEGFHRQYGGAHAEAEALHQVTDGEILGKSTLYVNLEPCAHQGKTPPCTQLIIAKGIKNVVIANRDPFPLVNGKGIEQLEHAGVVVTKGILENEGKNLNRRFFTFHQRFRPYIILKWAQTVNGYFAPDSHPEHHQGITWISNRHSRALVHRWRSQEQAILVGRGTVMADNPRLNVRGMSGKDPVRIVIDPKLSLKPGYHVFDNKAKTFIFNFIKDDNRDNIRYVKITETHLLIPSLLKVLYDENIQSVLVEGGAATIRHFIASGHWDEARIFTGRITFENGLPAPVINGMLKDQMEIESDSLCIFTNNTAS